MGSGSTGPSSSFSIDPSRRAKMSNSRSTGRHWRPSTTRWWCEPSISEETNPLAYLDTPKEDNPFLGERGVRIYQRFDEVFRTQVRALLRASVAGDLWIMIPMVATVTDLATTLATIEEVRSGLEARVAPVRKPKIGTMIEVPSAALNAEATGPPGRILLDRDQRSDPVRSRRRPHQRKVGPLHRCRRSGRAPPMPGDGPGGPGSRDYHVSLWRGRRRPHSGRTVRGDGNLPALGLGAVGRSGEVGCLAATSVDTAVRALEACWHAAGPEEVRGLVGDMIGALR